MAGAGSVNLGTRVRAGAVPGVDPDHWKRFPERRDRGGGRDGAAGGEAGGDGPDSARGAFGPRGEPGAEVLGSGAPGAGEPRSGSARGLEASRMAAEAAVRVPGPRLSSPRAGCVLVGALELLNCSFLPGSRMGGGGRRRPAA